jgi:peptide/nickel transport system substrate-binding protein
MRVARLSAALAIAASLVAWPAAAKTFKFAFQGDLNALDSYTLNETFTQGMLSNVMEGLVRRDKDLKIIPALAERWETVDPLKWRFYLRKNVKFHGGEAFTADDVIFSMDRARVPESQVRNKVQTDAKFIKIDDHTLEVQLASPNPILHYEWDVIHIFSKSWAEKVGAVQPQSAKSTSLSSWALTANGTGAFSVASHEPGVKTVFKPHAGWWDKPVHNLTEVIFTTIKSDATRVAALLTGEIDMMDPVPVQDIERIKTNASTDVMIGPELRTIFLNMDQMRDELKYASVKGKNPFKDVRVRKAVYQAIDIEAIKSKVMRGMAVPSALLLSPLLFEPMASVKRYPYDVDAAKKLMADAGYAEGFDLRMDCPNDRYVNDAAICQAIGGMLARINIKVTLNAQPKAKYFEFAGQTGGYDSSFNLLGWTPGSFDSWNVLANIIGCRDEKGKGGSANYGGYCNAKIDEMTTKIRAEGDKTKRDSMIKDAYSILYDEVGLIPLHQQSLAWGVSKKVEMVQRADNSILFMWTRMK